MINYSYRENGTDLYLYPNPDVQSPPNRRFLSRILSKPLPAFNHLRETPAIITDRQNVRHPILFQGDGSFPWRCTYILFIAL